MKMDNLALAIKRVHQPLFSEPAFKMQSKRPDMRIRNTYGDEMDLYWDTPDSVVQEFSKGGHCFTTIIYDQSRVCHD